MFSALEDILGAQPTCQYLRFFSEYDMGHEIGSQLSLHGILVKYAATDGDSRSAQGLGNDMKILQPMWSVQRLADPPHLGQSQF